MAGSIVTTITGTTTSSVPLPMNHRIAPVNISWVGTGSGATGSLAYSMDDPWLDRFSGGQYAASGTWISLATFTAGVTTFTGTLTFPIRALRLTASGAGANDTVTLTVVQGGITNG